MGQVNVNPPSDSGDRSAAAGINLVTVLIVLVVILIVGWFLFTGPLANLGGGGTNNPTDVNVKVEAPAPSGGEQKPTTKP
jgi:hypothetical protein